MEVQTRILQAMPEWSDLQNRNGLGLSKGTFGLVALKVMSWNVAGLAGDSTDIFLSQISMLTDWDVLLLLEYFRKTGHHTSELERTSERCWGGAGRWTAVELDGQLTITSVHLPHKRINLGDVATVLTEIQDFMRETRTAPDPGWRLQCQLSWTDRPSPRGRVDTRTENTDGHKRYFERTSIALCCGSIGPDGDEHLDGRRLRSQMDFILEETESKTSTSTGFRMVQDGPQGGTCCPPVESENEILCETWSELAWLEARRLLAKGGRRDGDRLDNWNVMAPLLLGTAKTHKMMETKEMTATELQLKTILLQKKRQGRHLGRAELNRLCRSIWRKRRVLKRENI